MNQEFYPNFSQEVLDRCLKDFDLPLSLKLNELSMGQKKKVFIHRLLAPLVIACRTQVSPVETRIEIICLRTLR